MSRSRAFPVLEQRPFRGRVLDAARRRGNTGWPQVPVGRTWLAATRPDRPRVARNQ